MAGLACGGLTGRVVESITSPEPGGSLTAAYSADGKVGLWDRPTGMLRFVFPVAGSLFAGHVALAFSPDRDRLAFAGGGEARLWDTATGKHLRHWTLPTGTASGPFDTMAYADPAELLLYRAEQAKGRRQRSGSATCWPPTR